MLFGEDEDDIFRQAGHWLAKIRRLRETWSKFPTQTHVVQSSLDLMVQRVELAIRD